MKRIGVLGLASVSVWISGCDDTSSADKTVQKNLADSEAELAKLDPFEYRSDPANLEGAMKTIEQAAGENRADPVWRAAASGLAGDASVQLASARQSDLVRVQQAIRSELLKLRVLTQRLAMTNTLTSGYNANNPSQTIADIERMIRSIQGDAQTPTWSSVTTTVNPNGRVVTVSSRTGNLPTLAAIKQQISRLEGEIASRKDQLSKLASDRQMALTEAEKKFSESEKIKGQTSVALFTEGTELRRKSEEIGMQMDLVQEQLNRLESDLAVARGQQEAANAAIKQLQDQIANLQAAWKASQDTIARQKSVAETAFKGEEPISMSIETVVTEIAKQLVLVESLRTKVLEDWEQAAKFYKQAAESARIVGTDKRVTAPAPGSKPYKDLKESVHTSRFNLPLAGVQRAIGTVSAEKAALSLEIERVSADLKKELSAANLAVPSDLPSITMDEIRSALNAAEEDLNESNNILINVNSGDTPQPLVSLSKQSRLITLYRLIALESLKQRFNTETDSNLLNELNNQADALKQEMLAAGISFPPLPGGFVVHSKSTSTSPTTPPETMDVESPDPVRTPGGGFGS
jgi:predicted  nucleic acid-binding Zn-ribbon protein